MNTLAVMCMELQRTRPSMTPLLRTTSSTCGVMFTNAIFDGMLNVRYSVKDFILSLAVDAVAPSLLEAGSRLSWTRPLPPGEIVPLFGRSLPESYGVGLTNKG